MRLNLTTYHGYTRVYNLPIKGQLICYRGENVPVHDLKAYGEMKAKIHPFLTLALDGSVWLVLRPSLFTPGKYVE